MGQGLALQCPSRPGSLPSAQTRAPPHCPRLNREHKHVCEMDWSDKVEAYNIDETCTGYHNQSTEVQFHPHSTKFEERWATPSPPRAPPHKHPIPNLYPRSTPSGPVSAPGSSPASLAPEALTTDGRSSGSPSAAEDGQR